MRSALLAALILLAPATPAQPPASVWSVDFVRTKPGLHSDYLEFSRLNWAAVRDEMKRAGAVKSFMVITATSQAEGEAPFGAWDVMLVTEYASRAAYDAREQSYEAAVALLRKPGEPWPRPVNGRGPRALAEIAGSTVLDTFHLVR